MAPSRLNDSHKKEIIERYRAGETSASIAALYGCSANTVSRTVRSLLSSEEYTALKIQRSTRSTVKETRLAEININEIISTEVTHSENGAIGDDLHQKEPPSTAAVSTNYFSNNSSILRDITIFSQFWAYSVYFFNQGFHLNCVYVI